MDITRHNYEEFFLLYVDHELNAAERKVVEYFVQQNPDLEEELIMLQQSVLRPDEKLSFARKENLLKNTASQGLVNENNYEEYFVQYGDDELTNEEKDLVEQFVYKYPQYQVEFELIQQARLFPDQSLGFPDKAYLYRTEEDDHKVVPFAWWRIAAAAIVLITIGSLGLYIAMSDNQSTNGASVTQTTAADLDNINQIKPVPDTKNVVIAKQDPKKTVEPAITNNDQKDQNIATFVKTEKKSSKPRNIHEPVNVPQTNDQQMVKYLPVQEPSESSLSAKPVAVAVASHTAVKPITAENINSKPAPVATAIAVVIPEEQHDNKTYVLNTSVNKTPLRGFFRKVSRVVDKATNFEPDEHKKGGIRIANFEIALQ